MPHVERSARAGWEGNLARGEGRISAPSGLLSDAPYSAASRIAARPETTSPEELLSAAHAGCFAMSLAGELRDPEARIEVTANVVLDEVEGQGHRIVESQLTVRAAVSEVTRSPSRKPRAALPTRATTPQNSCPRTTGTLTGQLWVLWY